MYIVTYTGSTCAFIILFTGSVAQVQEFVLGIRPVGVEPIREIFNAIFPAKFKLKSPVFHRTEITPRFALSDISRHRHFGQHICCLLIIIVKCETQTLVKETHIHTKVSLSGSFPLNIRIGGCCGRSTVNHGATIFTRFCIIIQVGLVTAAKVIILTTIHQGKITEISDRLVTILSP